MGGGRMGSFTFNKPKPIEEPKEETKVTELDKIKTYVRKKEIGDLKPILITVIENKYNEGITDYNKCLEFVDLCAKNESNIIEFDSTLTLDYIYNIYMTFEDRNITSSLLNMVLKQGVDFSFYHYMFNSRAYFTDSESWAARMYEVLNDNIDTKEAINEDKMRLGIYSNISNTEIEELNRKLSTIKIKVNSLNYNIKENEKNMEKINLEVKEKSDKIIDNIDATFKSSIKEIQTFTDGSLETIKRILNANPSSRVDILKELEKQFNTIEAFDESIDIKERYQKLLSLKRKTIIYHPKFDEVLKYVLAGNTVCLTGPSKCGKTNLVKELARLLNLSFNNIGNIYDETTEINGYYDLNTNYNKTTFHESFENGGITLIKNIDNAPIQAIHALNNIISNFKYNPYIFGDKKVTNPSPNFRLIMTNNNNLKLDGADIDNLVRINIDYDENFEKSLTDSEQLYSFLSNLRKVGVNITTSTFIDITKHLKLGLLSIEELILNYIIQNNSIDFLKRSMDEIEKNQINTYNSVLKKLLKG